MGESAGSAKKGFDEGYWSDDEIRETFLEEQRQYIWNEDYFRRILVPLFKLKKDSAVLDVGCGLGFLGRKLAEFVPEGKIVCVDLDSKLVEIAKKKTASSANSSVFDFRVGNACELPIENDSVDLAICQTLLMHLDDPMKAISEMKRVTKKGGTVAAIEPDYTGHFFFDTAHETLGLSVDDRSKMWRWSAIANAGKKKLGRGDNEIGSRVPHLFFKSGLKVIDVRMLDRAFWLIPSYEGHEVEVKHMTMSQDIWVDKTGMREEFFAGGGTEEEWKEYYAIIMEAHKITQQQIKDKTFAISSAPAIMITVAEKP